MNGGLPGDNSNLVTEMEMLIHEIMAARGWSLRELAGQLGMSHQKLSYWLNHGENLDEMSRVICKLQKHSKRSWSRFGKSLDAALK